MLIDKIREDMKTAMKAREAMRVETLRFLLSEVKNVGINEKRELDDDVVKGVLARLAKQRREGIEQFRGAGRDDLAAAEEAQLAILEAYLPRQLSDAELEAALRAIIQEVGAASKKDMGKVMKAAMERLAGAADGKRISAVTGRLL
jgi:uncharacterized protein YqeY